MNMSECLCGCGKTSRNPSGYHSDCKFECKCGCGGRARYAYVDGHRPNKDCVRCGKHMAPIHAGGNHCSQCRRHIRGGGPVEQDASLVTSRKMQKSAPEGRRWCSGCEKYRLIKFFGRSQDRYYSRCKPCHRSQSHASRVKKKYNITPERYQQIKDIQGGKCAICQVATGASKFLAVDHDHSCCPSGGSCGNCVRGALCSRCNQMLGHGRDNPEFFERAAAYLRRPPAQFLGIHAIHEDNRPS